MAGESNNGSRDRSVTSGTGDVAATAQRTIEALDNDVAVKIEPGDIIESGVVGGAVTLPGRPNSPTIFPGIPYVLAAQPDTEYVAGGLTEASLAYARSLPQYIDDLTARHGVDLYYRMLRDPQVSGDLNYLALSVLANGLSLTPTVEDETKPGYKQALKAMQFCQTNLDELETPFIPWLREMLDAVAVGNRVSEIVYRQDGDRLMLQRLKPKPPNVYAFVVDNRQNTIGLLGALAGRARTVIVNASILDPELVPNLIPRNKFAVYSYRPINSDPRGSSVLYPAYDAWYRKQNHMMQLFKYLVQFGSPSLFATTGEKQVDTPRLDGSGNPLIDSASGLPLFDTPEQSLLKALERFQNGSIAVGPFGTLLTPIYPQGNGEAFRAAIDLENREISKAILSQTLTTNEGQHESRAASETAKSGTDLIVDWVEQTLSIMIRREILAPLLELNFDREYARRFTPLVTLSKVQEVDFGPMATAVAALETSGYIAESQKDGIDSKLGLTKRTPADKADADAKLKASLQPKIAPGAKPADDPEDPEDTKKD